jgi:hypothetical protein
MFRLVSMTDIIRGNYLPLPVFLTCVVLTCLGCVVLTFLSPLIGLGVCGLLKNFELISFLL